MITEKNSVRLPEPDISKQDGTECYAKSLHVEYQQSYEEGKDVEPLRRLFEAAEALPNDRIKGKLADVLFEAVMTAPQRKDYPYVEPNDPDEIRAEREAYPVSLPLPDDETLLDRITGAWYGRICGCLLGKPVEGISSGELKTVLVRTGNWPMTRYIDREEITPEVSGGIDFPIGERAYPRDFGRMPVDDDTNYMLIALDLLEHCGKSFSPDDVMRTWLSRLVKGDTFTAERVAYRNFLAGYRPTDSAIRENPFREWIGAQIRGDVFGYVCPCDPEAAAGLAYRDACISHVKNGIYGEMWASAMIAAAFGAKTPEEAVLRGLAEIPRKSRLHEAISEIVRKHRAGVPEQECFDDITGRWDEREIHAKVHTISNAEIVAASLLYGEGDYARSVGRAVMTGFDTDCNGATVGSVMGAMKGLSGLPETFTERICDTLDSTLLGRGTVSVKEMARRTFAVAKDGSASV